MTVTVAEACAVKRTAGRRWRGGAHMPGPSLFRRLPLAGVGLHELRAQVDQGRLCGRPGLLDGRRIRVPRRLAGRHVVVPCHLLAQDSLISASTSYSSSLISASIPSMSS